MPISVFAQAVAWTSGFANYVIPIIIILFYLYFNKNLFSDENIEIKNRWIIPFALLGFINSLFVEHATLYNVLLSIVVILYYLIRKHKIVLANLFYMIGSILGTVLMFSNEAYHTIFQSQDTYRAIEQDNIIIRFSTLAYIILIGLLIGVLFTEPINGASSWFKIGEAF